LQTEVAIRVIKVTNKLTNRNGLSNVTLSAISKRTVTVKETLKVNGEAIEHSIDTKTS
jgi:hypothetical protein